MAWSAPLYRVYERRLFNSLRPDCLPSHLGVILDGHRRFARAEGLSDYTASYRSGMAKLGELLEWSAQLRLPAVTAGFSRQTTCSGRKSSWIPTSRC